MEATGSWDDYMCNPIDGFADKVLAEKVVNGLNDSTEEAIAYLLSIDNDQNALYTEYITSEEYKEMRELVYDRREVADLMYGIRYLDDVPNYSIMELELSYLS